MLCIGVSSIKDSITSDVMCELYSIIPKEKKLLAERFYYDNDRHRTVLAYALLFYLVKTNFGIDTFTLYYNEYGKPYISEYSDIYFNISHSGDWAVCGIADDEIGIDIEKINKTQNIDVLCGAAEHIFTEPEQIYLQSDSIHFYDRFFRMWTAKEAMVKCSGCGLSGALEYQLILKPDGELISENNNFQIRQINMFNDYSMSICMKKIETEINVLRIGIDEIIQSITHRTNGTSNC